MEDLYYKFEEAKTTYVLKNKKRDNIINSLIVTDELEEQVYTNEKTALTFFQRKIDFSSLEEEYYVFYEKNEKFLKLKNASCNITCDIKGRFSGIEMYVLIPKDKEEETLCLFLERVSFRKVIFDFKSKDYYLECFPFIFVEQEINVLIDEFDFNKLLDCKKQLGNKSFYNNLLLKEINYKKIVKEYLKKNYLNKTFKFKVPNSYDFQKYISEYKSEDPFMSAFDKTVAKVIQKNYEILKNSENKITELTDIVSDFATFKFIVSEKIAVAEIYSGTNLYIGKLHLSVESVHVQPLASWIRGHSWDLIEEIIFQDKLSKYINDDFEVKLY